MNVTQITVLAHNVAPLLTEIETAMRCLHPEKLAHQMPLVELTLLCDTVADAAQDPDFAPTWLADACINGDLLRETIRRKIAAFLYEAIRPSIVHASAPNDRCALLSPLFRAARNFSDSIATIVSTTSHVFPA